MSILLALLLVAVVICWYLDHRSLNQICEAADDLHIAVELYLDKTESVDYALSLDNALMNYEAVRDGIV